MYKVLSHTADVGIEVRADSLEELFIDAAKGWKFLVLENSPTRPRQMREITLNDTMPEDLLVQWLSELNFYLTARHWLLHDITAFTLRKESKTWHLSATVTGEPLDPERHYLFLDIKGVTYHQLNIEPVNGHFRTRIIFDI